MNMNRNTNPAKSKLIPIVAVLAIVVAASVGYLSSSSNRQRSGLSAKSPSSSVSVSPVSPVVPKADTGPLTSNTVFTVTNYGADPTGLKDSTSAIRSAIAAAEAVPGSEVYFPAGRYILTQNLHQLYDFVINVPVHIVGAGVGATTIVNEVGAKTAGVMRGTDMFVIQSLNDSTSGGGSGTTIYNMTLDSRSYDAGTSILDYGNNTVLKNLLVYGPTSMVGYNPDAFGIRVIAICNATNRANIMRVGNVVDNVTIIGNGGAGNTELDFSCQVNSSIDNVNITGNGMDFYFCRNVQMQNATFVSVVPRDYSWVITSSHDISMSNITASDNGGVVQNDTADVTSNIAIANEIMKNRLASIRIGDAQNVSITGSVLGNILLWPSNVLNGVSVSSSQFGRVSCKSSASVSALVGINCSS